MNIMQMLSQLQQNPGAFLSRYGIPQNLANDPQAVVQHLMNQGRISQEQYNNAVKMAKNFGVKI